MLGAGLALAGSPARAAPAHVGFPGFDAARERVILGGVPGTSNYEPVPQARSSGTWREDQHALAFDGPEVGREGVWLAGEPLADGLVRLRVELGGKVDMSLLVRAGWDPAVALKTGYGVSLAGDRLRLDRWDHGMAVPLTPAVKVAGLGGKLRRVEVVVLLIGPQISAQVYDGGSFELLASVSGRDEAYPAGQVGVRAGPKQAREHRFTLLAAMAIALPGAPAQVQGPYGSLRWLFVDPRDRGRVPPELRGKIVEPVPVEGVASELALALGPSEAEMLRRAGARIVAERGDLPWAATDPEFRAAAGRPPERTPTGFRVDASYKDPALVEGLLRAYAERFPGSAALRQIGASHDERPLWALKISDEPERDEDEPAVLINGAHHGSELLSIEYALDAAAHLLEGAEMRRAVAGLEIWVVPLVNPDGNFNYMHRSRASGRKNGRDNDGDGAHSSWDGVDLNRNYPFQWGALGELGSRSLYSDGRYRGPSPASEPETGAMMRLAAERRFVAAISFHTLATAILSPYMIEGVAMPAVDDAWAFAEGLAAAAPSQPNGRPYRVKRRLYAVDGTDQDWHRFTYGTLAYIVEGSHHNPREPELRRAAVAATRPVWTALLEQVLTGPAIVGHVRDTTGAPVEAEVVVEELAPVSGEHWTSRPRDGRFDRVLPGPGRYTLRARVGECPAVRRTVEARPRVSVELVVQRTCEAASPADTSP